jgi:hypothetical protein
MGKDGKNAIRLTTTLTKQQHKALERLAQKYGVKLAWLVRKSVERLLEQEAQNQSLMLADLQGGSKNGKTS